VPNNHARRYLALLAVPAAGLAMFAVAAIGRTAVNCDARQGTTLNENGAVRVFQSKGITYACARPTGRALRLKGMLAKTSVSGVELGGTQFVAWTAHDAAGTSLWVLDVKRASYRQVAFDAGVGAYVAGYALNGQGTLVWLDALNGTCVSTCHYEVTVYASTTHGRSRLATHTNNGPAPKAPITEVGLSQDGSEAYWLLNGVAEGAHVH
jgi:hypothetical protein